MDEIINPGEFTEKELLKLVYRDLHKLKTEFEDYKKNNNSHNSYQRLELQITKLENRVDKDEAIKEEARKQLNRTLYFIGFCLAIIQFLIKYLIK